MAPELPSHDASERSVPDRFESFDLSIERIGETYRAQVIDSPLGPRAAVSIDAAGLEPDERSAAASTGMTRDVERRPTGRDDLRRIGEKLFRTVFVDVVATAFRASVQRARSEGVGLRVLIRLDGASELAVLPWEALWDPEGKVFLADQPDLPVVRTLSVPAESPIVTRVRAPLRVLALLPEPQGEDKLSGAKEWRRIREQLASLVSRGEVATEQVKPATLDSLGNRIDDGSCHVLHVVAHGGPGDRGAGGQLKLEDAAGQPDTVSGGDLARALERREAPRLVVLSACHGARTAVDDAFDGMAQHLLNRGVPAVVAMRTAISDAAAVSFAAALYRELARGRSVEGAMVEARRALSLGKHRTEWATPALYLRGENVRIVDAGSAIGLPPAPPVSGRRFRNAALPLAAALAAGLLGVWLWNSRAGAPELEMSRLVTVPEETVEPATGTTDCPPPLGLQDLKFVKIEPDVVDLGDRKVIVDEAFCIGTKEVTRRDWLAVMGGDLPRSERAPVVPVTDVTPEDARAFLGKLEAREVEVTYRLPTDLEWELAARAGQKTTYFFGDDPAELHRFGNCKNPLASDGYEAPAPVGLYQPNDWGLYDVHGNVAEWVEWPEDAGPALDEDGQQLALRLGGSFDNALRYCSFLGSRSRVRADNGNRPDTGFRVVRVIAEDEDE